MLVSTHFIHYGMELANGLAEIGLDVGLVFHPDNARRLMGADFADYLNPRVTHLSMPGRHSPKPWTGSTCRNLRWLPRTIAEFAPDVVHLQASNDVASLWTAWRTKVPLAVTIHDVTAHPGDDEKYQPPLFQKIVKRLLIPSAVGRGVQFVTHGEILKDSLARVLGVPTKQIHAIPHGILGRPAPLGFSFASENAATPTPLEGAARKPGTLRTLFFGRMERYKGLHILRQAIPLVLKQNPQVEFVIAGRGSALDEELPALSTLENVTIHRRYLEQGEVEKLFQQTHLNIVPYVEASQSGVIAFGFGYGVPALASKVGALPEVVHHRDNGLLVEADNPQALADAILIAAREEGLLKTLRAGVERWATGPLSWPVIAKQTKDVYLRCLDGIKPPS
jgi:glycosyltransferase involved in cell wall biosynthesis